MNLLETLESSRHNLIATLADMVAQGADQEMTRAVAEIIDDMRDAMLMVKHPGIVRRMPCYITASGVHAAMKGEGFRVLCGEAIAFDQRVGFSNRCPSCEKCIEALKEMDHADK
jgi:hypothetical protein